MKNKRLCNRLKCEPTSQRGMWRCMHRRASSRCQGRGEPLWFPEGNCHRGNGPLPVVRSKEYPRRFDQWWWALRYVFSEVCFFRQLFLCALWEFARSDKNGKYNYATTKRASKMQGGRVPAQLREYSHVQVMYRVIVDWIKCFWFNFATAAPGHYFSSACGDCSRVIRCVISSCAKSRKKMSKSSVLAKDSRKLCTSEV